MEEKENEKEEEKNEKPGHQKKIKEIDNSKAMAGTVCD